MERECARKQALLRASQRAAGIQAPASKAKGKRRRRPTVRALKMVDALQPPGAAEHREEGVLA